jgi:hypothetical protein
MKNKEVACQDTATEEESLDEVILKPVVTQVLHRTRSSAEIESPKKENLAIKVEIDAELEIPANNEDQFEN